VNPNKEAGVDPDRRSDYPGPEQIRTALRRCWQPVARVGDLAAGPRRAVLLGEPLTIFLTEAGEPAVLADRCPHRGASLSLGQVRGEGIRCPYHGWEWEGVGGRCTRIPSLPDQRQIPPEARVAAYPARAQWGLVWTVLDEPLGDLPSTPWLEEGDWQIGHGEPFELPVSFGVMIENFRDVAHFAFVHERTMGTMPEVIESLRPDREGRVVTMHREMRTGKGADDVWGGMRDVTYRLVAPNFVAALMHTTDGYRCLLHAARAIRPGESAHYWIEGMANGCGGASLEEAIASESRIYAEDIAIVSSVQPAELSLELSTEISTLSDAYTLAYREAFNEFVAVATATQSTSNAT
jgi:phenylpropionate dioxygenase-like ring-hydroxylating dioxygenase large terminal subunit